MHLRRVVQLLPLLLPALLDAQTPPRPDSTRVVEVEELTVTVTRTPEPLARAPRAVDILDARAIRRGQATLGLDEALSNLPGVYVANRYNYSVDQRLSLRGAGSRASFGSRGVKIVLDGIPQTLPDGQSQLTNVDLGTIGRIEVLRGASSALYGNAAGGVIYLTSLPTAPDPAAATVRSEIGSFGLAKHAVRLSGRAGSVSAAASFARTTWDGFREHSRFEGTTADLALDWLASGSTMLTMRYRAGDSPVADNPGALDTAELALSRRSAPTNNIVRDAGKDVLQRQLSVTLKHFTDGGAVYEVAGFRLTRDLDNPLASNSWNLIDRLAGGFRLQGTHPLGTGGGAKLTAGFDLQSLRDDRTNLTPVPAVGPVTDTTTMQRELVTEFGPFAELSLARGLVHVSLGLRYDAIHFTLEDQLLDDGNDSGERTMSSASGGLGVSVAHTPAFTSYVNISTGFETPTTTELAISETGVGGFNDSLGPQRSLSLELGGRGTLGDRFSWSVALFNVRVTDALTPYAEAGGRSFFRNAGETRNRGVEVGVAWRPTAALTLQGAWTHADYRFTDYLEITNAGADTLDFGDNRLPGVPAEFVRLGLRSSLGQGLWLDLDHTLSSEMYADDANTLRIDGWGSGVTNLRFGWEGQLGRTRLAPFVAVNNVGDRRYIGSVTVNGFNGRVFEPSPGRNYYLGVEMGWRKG
jgi:iron complex outermembrane receptor protein